MTILPTGMGVTWLILLLASTSDSAKRASSLFSTPVNKLSSLFSANKNQYGCEKFNEDNWFPYKARLGDQDSVEPIMMKDHKAYEKFLNKITLEYIKFIETGLTFNNLNNYLRFFKAYTSNDQKVRKFYENHQIAASPQNEPGGNIMTLMEKLAHVNSKISKSSYFITRSQVLNQEQIARINSTSVNLTEIFKHDQVAGVIKYSFGGELGQSGYIILDPEIGARKPVVIMDGQIVNTGQSPVEFSILKPMRNSQYVVAKVRGVDGAYLYFYRRAYCSIVETTIKPSLVKFKHWIRKHNPQGEVVAQFAAHVGHEEPTEKHKVYNVQITLRNGEELQTHNVPWMKNLRSEIQNHQAILNALCEQLNIPEGGPTQCMTYWTDSIELLQEIYWDHRFQADCDMIFYRW